MENQLRTSSMGGVVGLDYAAIKLVADSLGIRTDRFFWEKIHLLERILVRSYKK